MKAKNIFVPKALFGILLTLCLLAPSLLELGHLAVHKKHQLCQSESVVHFHDGNDNCELIKFHLNQKYQSLSHIEDEDIVPIFDHLFAPFKASFFSFSKVYRLKRGPPYLV